MKTIFYDWGGLNVWLFQMINGVHSPLLDRMMLLATSLADHANFALYIAAMALVALILTHRTGRRAGLPWLAVLSVFALGFTVDGWLVGWLKELFSFPRPPLALPASMVHVVGHPEMNLQHSFPSGHTSFAMLVVASLWPALNRPGRLAGWIFVVWVGISRVSLGAHFPADVVAGALSSLLVVLLVQRLVHAMLHDFQ